MRKRLDDAELQAALTQLPKWGIERGELVRTIALGDFRQAMEFVNRAAALAEEANHHPDIDIRYNRVRLALVTHDAGGLTDNDIQMAAKLDRELPE